MVGVRRMLSCTTERSCGACNRPHFLGCCLPGVMGHPIASPVLKQKSANDPDGFYPWNVRRCRLPLCLRWHNISGHTLFSTTPLWLHHQSNISVRTVEMVSHKSGIRPCLGTTNHSEPSTGTSLARPEKAATQQPILVKD